jgi:alginate O-acetyltransferase complex protein AlgJ
MSASTQHHERRGGPTDPSHDEELRRGILHTAISRPLAWVMCLAFLAMIYLLPLAQALLERKQDEPSMLLDLFTRAPTRESFKQYEEDLENASYAKAWVQPRVQLELTRRGRVGNKKAVVGVGKDAGGGWLYYAPGVQAVSGPGFLEPNIHDVRLEEALDAGEPAIHPDPRPAVLAFHQALRTRGIQLILFPVPDKATMQPRELHGRGAGAAELPAAANRDFYRFTMDMLEDHGVMTFDARPPVLKAGEPPRYLTQDTHWTPAWMEEVAGKLAAHVRQHVPLPVVSAPTLTVAELPIARVGDIVDMLKLPEAQGLFRPQVVTVHPVRQPNGEPWQPDEKADVLLLGDSFTNVFSQAPMGWGEGAGLAPHLARALGRPLDVIAQNDSGAFATRKLLSEALGAGEDRLAGKKLVIWEFAARELSVGDWRPYDYQLKTAGK